MKQPSNIIQLFKDFALLIIKTEELLLEENIRDFLIECEGLSLQEAEQKFPLNYTNIIEETEEYAKELEWYISNHSENIFNKPLALNKLTFYRKRSLSGLKTLKEDRDSTPDQRRKQYLSSLLIRFITLFNELLIITRNEIEDTSIANQTNWVELYELSDIDIKDL
jgi:hypothetical protein